MINIIISRCFGDCILNIFFSLIIFIGEKCVSLRVTEGEFLFIFVKAQAEYHCLGMISMI